MTDTPGLKRKKNKDGSERTYWMARADIVRRGFMPSSVRLCFPDTAEGAEQLSARCHILQAEMLAWSASGDHATRSYDGTILGLSRLYQTDEDSPYKALKWNTRVNVTKCLKIIESTVGQRQVSALLGPDFKRWHRSWGEPKPDTDIPRPWRAKSAMDTVRQLVGYGVTLGHEDCIRADIILSKIRFATPPARTAIMTADHVHAIRPVAHALGYGSIALATVLQFELALRQKDVIGEWEPVAGAEGGIRHRDTRWTNGLLWSDIDADNILRKVHTKTGFAVEHDLKLHPTVLEEIALIPEERRVGPMLISESTGEPYKHRNFTQRWRLIANAAGIPKTIQNMDARAGAITEAYDLGAAETDVMKSAGHKNRQTSARYNRGTIEQTSRVARMRMEKRTANKD